MIITIIILSLICLCLIGYIILAHKNHHSTQKLSELLIKKIDFNMGVENAELKKSFAQKDELILLYKEFVIRMYIEYFYMCKIDAKEYHIYTVDALESLKNKIESTITHFYTVWGEKLLEKEERTLFFKEKILDDILARVDHLIADTQKDFIGDDDSFCIFDLNNNCAFDRFFHAVETSLSGDMFHKKCHTETK